MKYIVVAVLTLALGFTISNLAVADDILVNTDDTEVSTGDSGTFVATPGVVVQLPAPQAAPTVPTMQTGMSFVLPTSTMPVSALPPPASLPPTAVMVATPPMLATSAPVNRGNYVNAQLSGMNFSNQNFSRADFSNATLTDANFSGADLTGANFTNANLTGAIFSDANLSGAILVNADMDSASLTNASLSHADLTNASMKRTVITNANFDAAVLTNVDMGQAIRQTMTRPAAPPPVPTFIATPPAAAAMRPALTDASTISGALKIDPARPERPHKIDLTINFDFNSDKVTSDGAKQVREIAAALGDPALQKEHIMIEGHTDNVGSDAYNQDLSYRRSLGVLRTLIENYKVPAAQLSAQGFGKTKPVATNDSDLGRALNRRVTLVNLGH